jgi:hypothetical protein
VLIQLLLQGMKVSHDKPSDITMRLIFTVIFRWTPFHPSTITPQYAHHGRPVSLLTIPQVCAIINACFLPFTEGLAPFRELARIGPLVLLSNAGVAFGLNVAAVFLIGAAGGLVLTLAGVFKVCQTIMSLKQP